MNRVQDPNACPFCGSYGCPYPAADCPAMQKAFDDIYVLGRNELGDVIVTLERRNDDPELFDDCWHRGPYWAASIKEGHFRCHFDNDDAGKVRDMVRDFLKSGSYDRTHYEEVGPDGKSLMPWRVFRPID